MKPIIFILLARLFTGILWPSGIEAAEPPDWVISVKPPMINELAVRRAPEKQLRTLISKQEKGCPALPAPSLPQKRNETALVLSGGVSKGLALIGALKYLEEAGIRVDGIAGTSMGALIGAYYSAGYTADQIKEVVTEKIDWSNIFTDLPPGEYLDQNLLDIWDFGGKNNVIPRINPEGIKSGQNVSSLLTRYFLPAMAASGNCFDELPIPLAVTSTNMTRFEETIFREGSLSAALKASMSFPVIFTPTYINGEKYRDGGIVDNFPVNTAILEFKPRLVIGVDVSDKSPTTFDSKPLFPFLSAYRITLDALDSLSAPITLKTKKQFQRNEECHPSIPGAVDAPPCQIILHMDLQGGFTDFKRQSIESFIRTGYEQAGRQICAFLKERGHYPGPCGKEGGSLREPLLKFLDEIGIAPEQTALSREDRALLSRFAAALEKAPSETAPWDDHRKTGENILQGIAIEYRPLTGEILLRSDPGITEAGLKSLILAASDLSRQLSREGENLSPWTGPPFSSAKFISGESNGALTVKIYSWDYRPGGFEFSSNLTDRAQQADGSVLFLDQTREGLEDKIAEVKNRYLCPDPEDGDGKTAPCDVQGRAALPKGSLSSVKIALEDGVSRRMTINPRYQAPVWSSDRWKKSFYLRIKENLAAAPSVMNLASDLEKSVNPYYVNGNTEYVRLERISRSDLEISEKKNSPPWWGWWYFDYQYDTVNGHDYALSAFQNRERVNLSLNGALLDYFNPDNNYGRYLDVSLTWFNFLDAVNSIRGRYWTAKKIENIDLLQTSGATFPLKLMYNEWGIDLSIPLSRIDQERRLESGAPNDLAGSALANRYGFGVFDWNFPYILGTRISYNADSGIALTSSQPGALSSVPLIGSSGSQSYLKVLLEYGYINYFFGKKIFFETELGGGFPDMGNEFLVHFQQEFNFKFKVLNGYTADFNYILGRNSPKTGSFPLNEYYSMGGYFPWLDRRFWRENRFDFIGSGINEKWGENISLAEVRIGVPVTSLNELQIFNPGTMFQADTIFDYGGVSDVPGVLASGAELGWGESLSLSFPVLATIQGKFNLNGGTKGTDCFESGKTCNVRIYFSTELSF